MTKKPAPGLMKRIQADKKADKKAGIKQGSAKDKAIDKKRGLPY